MDLIYLVTAGRELAPPPEILRRRRRRAERNIQIIAEHPASPRVIVMLVGEQSGAHPPGIQPELLHPGANLPAGKSDIDDQRPFRSGENQCISAASAAQCAQTDHNPLLSIQSAARQWAQNRKNFRNIIKTTGKKLF